MGKYSKEPNECAEIPLDEICPMYRRDQWTRLLDVSVDRDDLEPSYEKWWQNTAEKLYNLSKVGLCLIEVDIDVEELLGWCNAQNCPVDAKARVQYAVERVRQQRVLDAQERARWLETGAYDVVKDLYSEGIYNPVARAYFADRFDGSIAQLIEIADGRISARNIGPKRRKVLRDAIEQRNAIADPESGWAWQGLLEGVDMSESDLEKLVKAIEKRWPATTSEKVKRYVGKFFNATRLGTRISARVVGNHGTYTVSIEADDQSTFSACSCYIGKHGFCHHCHALALTFLSNPDAFVELKTRALHEVERLSDLEEYLRGVTLDTLIDELRANGLTQKAFAEAIGMNSRHLSAIKSSERRNRYHNELGATKLACLWVLEHFEEGKRK